MDRYAAISAFVAVAKAGGFSQAGRELGIPLPTLSRRVAELERQLGARLLNRSTRRVVLTEAGQEFFTACQKALEYLREAEDVVTGEYRVPKGDIAVTAPLGFGRLHLQPIVLEFLEAYPEINLRLLLQDRVANLVDEGIDAALRIAELADSSMIARPLGHIRMIVCASPGYLRRHGVPKHPLELLEHQCIAWSALQPPSHWWFRESGRDTAFPIRERFTTTSAESALAAAEYGVGLLQTTSYQAEEGVRSGRLALVLQRFECAPTPVSLIYVSNRLLPLKLRAFIDFAHPRLIKRLERIAKSMSTQSRQ
jgi:DNA-binding transcriptional LysR family regulator